MVTQTTIPLICLTADEDFIAQDYFNKTAISKNSKIVFEYIFTMKPNSDNYKTYTFHEMLKIYILFLCLSMKSNNLAEE